MALEKRNLKQTFLNFNINKGISKFCFNLLSFIIPSQKGVEYLYIYFVFNHFWKSIKNADRVSQGRNVYAFYLIYAELKVSLISKYNFRRDTKIQSNNSLSTAQTHKATAWTQLPMTWAPQQSIRSAFLL